jgi:hypothetical protein
MGLSIVGTQKLKKTLKTHHFCDGMKARAKREQLPISILARDSDEVMLFLVCL